MTRLPLPRLPLSDAPGFVRNRVDLTGSLFELDALRHTPAGIPVIEFRLLHESEQLEAGQMRRVECEMACVVLGDLARVVSGAQAGGQIRVSGFLAAKSLKRRSPVLHVDTIEFLEGANHGV